MENKYDSSKIYKLVCNDGYYYIGSTIQELNNRLNNHKKLSKTGVNKAYNYINSIGWDNVEIELIEKYKCNSKQELNNREEYYLNNSKEDDLCLNFKDINIYDNGKIYKLICEDAHYYIGSTTQKLYNRFNHHKFSAKTGTSKAYKYINSIGWDKVKIELVEDFPCAIKSELNQREEYYISKSKSDHLCLNINSALLTPEKRKEKRKENKKNNYEANKEAIIESHREYNEKNREKVDAYHAHYRLDNAEKRREYSRQYVLEHPEQVKETKKKYNQENKEKINEYWREYNNKDENKERIKQIKQKSAQKIKEQNADKIAKETEEKQKKREEKKKARITHDKTIVQCSCGGSYQNYQKKRHEESKKHQKNLLQTNS
jgi:hypothetical protein